MRRNTALVAAIVAVLAAWGVVLSAWARADERYEMTVYAVCQRLGAHPYPGTVTAIINDLLAIGYPEREVASIITRGVAAVCPESLPAVKRALNYQEGVRA